MMVTVVRDTDVTVCTTSGGLGAPMVTPMVTTVVSGVLGMSDPLHDGVEASVRTGNVFNDSQRTISLLQRVSPLNVVAVSVLVLLLLVAGVRVVDAVVEFVTRWTLQKKRISKN